MGCATTGAGSSSRCSPPSSSRRPLHADRPRETGGVGGESGEDRVEPERGGAHVAREELGEQVPEVGRQRQVAALEPVGGIEARPPAEYPPPAYRAAEDEHRRRMSVIRSRV